VRDKIVHVKVKMSIQGDWKREPLKAVSGISRGIANLEDTLREAVALAREQGRTWDDIGRSLGVSRQAAWERFSTD
jgi:hypothetical protein